MLLEISSVHNLNMKIIINGLGLDELSIAILWLFVSKDACIEIYENLDEELFYRELHLKYLLLSPHSVHILARMNIWDEVKKSGNYVTQLNPGISKTFSSLAGNIHREREEYINSNISTLISNEPLFRIDCKIIIQALILKAASLGVSVHYGCELLGTSSFKSDTLGNQHELTYRQSSSTYSKISKINEFKATCDVVIISTDSATSPKNTTTSSLRWGSTSYDYSRSIPPTEIWWVYQHKVISSLPVMGNLSNVTIKNPQQCNIHDVSNLVKRSNSSVRLVNKMNRHLEILQHQQYKDSNNLLQLRYSLSENDVLKVCQNKRECIELLLNYVVSIALVRVFRRLGVHSCEIQWPSKLVWRNYVLSEFLIQKALLSCGEESNAYQIDIKLYLNDVDPTIITATASTSSNVTLGHDVTSNNTGKCKYSKDFNSYQTVNIRDAVMAECQRYIERLNQLDLSFLIIQEFEDLFQPKSINLKALHSLILPYASLLNQRVIIKMNSRSNQIGIVYKLNQFGTYHVKLLSGSREDDGCESDPTTGSIFITYRDCIDRKYDIIPIELYHRNQFIMKHKVKRTYIRLYIDEGAGAMSIDMTMKFLQESFKKDKYHLLYTVIPVKAQDLLDNDLWISNTKLLVLPGGADSPYQKLLQGYGCERIHYYVESGGAYLGFCAGAYFGCDLIEFDIGGPLEIKAKRQLHFFKGIGRGPVFGEYDYNSNKGACVVDINVPALGNNDDNNDDKTNIISNRGKIFFNGGCTFQPFKFSTSKNNNTQTRMDRNCKVLATYESTGESAIVKIHIGSGFVLLSGCHPEFSPQILNHYLPDKYLLPLIPQLEASEVFRNDLLEFLLKEASILSSNHMDDESTGVLHQNSAGCCKIDNQCNDDYVFI